MKNEELHPNFARLYQDLTAKVSQQVLKLFTQNVKSFFSLKQSEKLTEEQKKKVNLPRYYTKNGLAPVYYTRQALSKKSFNKEGVIHFAGTDLKIKLDSTTLPEITHFGQINQVRIIPSTKNSKDIKLSDLLEEYCSGQIAQPLFTVEIVYTAPLTKQRSQNQSLNLRYETKIIKKVSKKDNKTYEIEKVELVEVSYAEEFLQSVAGIDQNLDQLAVGIVASGKTTAFTYDIKYLKSVNQHWNKEKAKLQEEISKQEKLLEELAEQDNLELKIIEGDNSKSDNVKNIEADIKNKKVLIKQLKNQIKCITTRRNRKIDNYVHQLSRKLINHLLQLGVKNIVYGKNTNFKKEINLGKVNNQNFVNIPFNLIIERLRYKACLAGINFMTVEESYTSKTSFLDREKLHNYKSDKAPKKYKFLGSRSTRSLFQSKDGHVIHADINASFNIIRKVSGDNIYDFINIGAIKVSSPKRWKINLQ